jgi:Transmembrane secretion effector
MGSGWSFQRFWAATGISNVADGMFGVALVLVALQITRSPLQISALEMAAGLPWLLFGLFAGAIADRMDRRRLMAGVQVVRAGVLAVVAVTVSTGGGRLWVLYLTALVMGVAETLYDTSAQTVLPKLVPGEQLDRANSRLTGAELVGNYFVGPPLGGLVVGVAAAAAFTTGSVLYLAAAAVLLTVRGSFRAERTGPRTSVRKDVGEGLRYLRDQPLLRRLGLLTGARQITFAAVSGVLPVYAVAPGPMGLSATGFGLFCAGTAVGAVAASLTGERVVARLGAARCVKITMLAFAVSEFSPLVVQPIAVLALWTVGTYFIIIWNVVTLTARQRLVPEYLLGRVNAVYRVVSWGVAPFGVLLGGVLAELIGLPATFVVFGVATALLTFGTLSIRDEQLRPPEPLAGEAEALKPTGEPPDTAA